MAGFAGFKGKWAMSAITLLLFGCASSAYQPDGLDVLQNEGPPPSPATFLPPSAGSPRVSRSQHGGTGNPIRPVANKTTTSIPSDVPFQVRIVAWVNNTPIFRGELLNQASPDLIRLRDVPEPEYSVRREKILKAALQRLIDDEVVYQDARKKLENNPRFLKKMKDYAKKGFRNWIVRRRAAAKLNEDQFKQVLRQQGMSLEILERQFERSFMVREYLHGRANPQSEQISRRDIEEYYNEHKNEFQTLDRVEWEDIFIAGGTAKHPTIADAKKFGLQLVRSLQAGQSIKDLLKYDDGDSRLRNGHGNGQLRGDIRPPELESYLFRMKPGQIGLVEISTGVHVFRLTKREVAGQMPLDAKVQKQIRTKLQNELTQREIRRIVRQLASRTVIEVDPGALK